MLKFSKISTNNLKELQKFITPSNNPKFFIHFSFVKRFGINPTSKYKTPLGFCAYPLTKEMYDHLISDSLPFAQDRPYILVFSVQNNLLNLINYNQKDLERDVLKLKNLTDKYNFNELVDIACKNARLNTPAGKFWSITRDFSNFDPKKWRSILMQLDYYGVNDAGLGIIHPNEPTQSVIFEQQSIIPIDILINPNTAFKFDIFSGLTKHERNMVENANKLRKQMYDSKYNKPKNHQFTIDDIKDIILNPNSYVNDPIITTHDIEKLNFKFKDFLNLFPSKKDKIKVIYYMIKSDGEFSYTMLSHDQLDDFINNAISNMIESGQIDEPFYDFFKLLETQEWSFYLDILMKSKVGKNVANLYLSAIYKILHAYENKKSKLNMSDIMKLQPLEDLKWQEQKDLDKITDIIDDNVADYLEKTYKIFLP